MVFSLFYVGSKPVAVGLFTAPWDKVAHFLFFSTIAVLAWFAADGRKPVLIALAIIAIGGLDELHQITLPGRSADWSDFLADIFAVVVMIYLLSRLTNAPRPLES